MVHLVLAPHGSSSSHHHAAHVEGVGDHAAVEHGLHVEHLLLLEAQLLRQVPYLLLLLDDVRLLRLVLMLQLLLHLAHHLTLLQGPLLLHVQLPPQLYYLVLLDHGLVVEDLSELLLVRLELLNIFVHLLRLLS